MFDTIENQDSSFIRVIFKQKRPRDYIVGIREVRVKKAFDYKMAYKKCLRDLEMHNGPLEFDFVLFEHPAVRPYWCQPDR